MFASYRIRASLKAAALHFGLSLLIACIAALLVFGIWYPFPFHELAGGTALFGILVAVDVVSGPLLTAVVFNPNKPRKELLLDLGAIALLQLAALLYGLYSIGLARPVILAFEVDRFVVVSAQQVDRNELVKAQFPFDSISWLGPRLVGTRPAKDGPETLKSIELSLRGLEPSARPDWWQDFEKSRDNVISRMKPVQELSARLAGLDRSILDDSLRELGRSPEAVFYLPLVSQKSLDDWITIMDARGNIVGYSGVGGF